MRCAYKTNTKQKYVMIITSEDERYNPNYPNGGGVQLGFFADHPWEGRFECFIAGDDHKELMEEIARCGCEGLFYQLYENENGNRIGYGVVDCDAIEDDINEYEAENYKIKEPYIEYNSIFRPSKETIRKNKKLWETIEQNVSIQRCKDGFNAEIKDLDLTFLDDIK